MHGTPWMDQNTDRYHQEGEIDFLIIHPKIGLLVLEVKGGRIELRDGEWYSVDRNDVAHPLKNSPISQAQRGMRALRKRLETSPSTKPFANQYRIQTGVVFPHIVKPKEGFGPDTPPQLIIDSSDLNSLELEQITERFDAIIVDEGQDFSDERWLCLQQLLSDPDSGIYYVFFDSEQGIYEQSANLPVRISDTVLTRNCRNTDQIHQQLLDYYQSPDKPLSSEIGGFEPEIFAGQPHDTIKALRQTFDRLFSHEGLYFLAFLIFWAVTLDISLALGCLASFGWLIPSTIACYYAFRVYTRNQSQFLMLTDLVRALFRGV
jgi:hypothetical protein